MSDDALEIRRDLSIPLRELRFSFSRSDGPGGQNVNKLNTRAELRFDLSGSPTLDASRKERLARVLSSRLTKAGEILVVSTRHRSQERNRADCLEKFRDLLRRALTPAKARRPTRPTRSSRERRLHDKRERSQKKRMRGKGGWES